MFLCGGLSIEHVQSQTFLPLHSILWLNWDSRARICNYRQQRLV
jgi:hypothetical protein